jgi:hypothetical protein
MNEGLLDGLKEIASFFGIHWETFKKSWMPNLDIPMTKVRGRWKADPQELRTWISHPIKKHKKSKSPKNP